MSKLQPAVGQYVFLPREGMTELVSILRAEGYTVVGPTVQEGVVSLRPIESADQLARGVRDEHGHGHYRLINQESDLQFAYVVGADSPKRYVFPPSLDLFQMHVANGEFMFDAGPPKPPKLAMLAMRPCDLAAIQVQDRVFSSPSRCESDPYYTQTRQQMLVIAVNCTHPGGNCFCASMGTGPGREGGFDLALTELRGGFLVKVGSRARRAARLQAAGARALRPRSWNWRELRSSRPASTWATNSTPSVSRRSWNRHRAPAMGRRGQALPVLRQLHDGLPDLLLCCIVGHHDLAATKSSPHAAVGVVLHAPVHLHDRRAGAEHDPRPLPALAAAQAEHLVGAVRCAAAAWAAGAASRGARSASTDRGGRPR